MEGEMKIDHDDNALDVVDKVNRALSAHKIVFVSDEKAHDGFEVFTLKDHADDESTLTSIVFATGERLGIAPADLSPTEVLTRIEAMHASLRAGVAHLVQHQANHKIPMPIVFIDDLLDDPVAAMETVRNNKRE